MSILQLQNSLVCPRCKNPLVNGSNELVCTKCSIRWPVKDGISVFCESDPIHINKAQKEKIVYLLDSAESDGFDKALYDYNKARVLRDELISEDQRIADWKYLLPLNRDSVALSFGCRMGTIPAALAETCKRVYVIDAVWERITFLNIRRRQHGIDNLCPIYVNSISDIPFPAKYFDIVSVRECDWGATLFRFRDLVQRVYGLLKEGGTAYLSVGNRLSYRHLFQRHKISASPPLHTIYGYRRMLRSEGFSDCHFYAPLPDHDGIPLFYLPLQNTEALNYFFENIFPLFEMVSPEVKKQYGFQYKLAKIGVRVALLFRLTTLAKFLVPGFGIIATK